MANEFDVFLSYSQRDGAEYGRAITQLLLAAGLTIFFDDGGPPSEEAPDRIRAAMARAKIVIVLVSPKADYTLWMRSEFAFALRRAGDRAKLLLVSIHHTSRDGPIGSLLGDRHWLDVSDLSPQAAAVAVVDELSGSIRAARRRRSVLMRFAPYIVVLTALAGTAAFFKWPIDGAHTPDPIGTWDPLTPPIRVVCGSDVEREALAMRIRSGEFQHSLRNANLAKTSLSETMLENVDLRGANLWAVDLSWASISGAHLDSAILVKARLDHADGRGAFFVDAQLLAADFRNADLDGVDLSRADLRLSDLRGAILSHATLRGADLAYAVFDHTTVWPEGFDPVMYGAVCADCDEGHHN